MAGRKIPKEVQQLFDKYTKNNVRRLKKDDAVNMLTKEFGLSESQATCFFETFDKDGNKMMSIWEFHQFYVCVGQQAQEIVDKFLALDKDGSGVLDADEAKQGLEAMETATGRNLEAKEVEFFLRTATGENNTIDLGQFTNLLYRLKSYTAEPPPK